MYVLLLKYRCMKEFLRKNRANIITSIRLIGSFILMTMDIRTVPFLIVYAICGISDVLDGFVARKLRIQSDVGRILDSISDILMNGTMIYKIWPVLNETLSLAGIYTIIGLVLSRLLLYIGYGIIAHEFLSTHSIWNKMTTRLVFMLPFVLLTPYGVYYCYLTMATAAVALIDELIHISIKQANKEAVTGE